MTDIVKHHEKTDEVALLVTDGRYWIGAYYEHLTHTNFEPKFLFVKGYFSTEDEGLAQLAECTGNEF